MKFTGYVTSLLVNLSLSRHREFIADAGAIAITHDPEAMISALRKISAYSDAALANVRETLFVYPSLGGIEGFSTIRPSIEARIDALTGCTGGGTKTSKTRPPSEATGSTDRIRELLGPGLLICALGSMSLLLTNASVGIGEPQHSISTVSPPTSRSASIETYSGSFGALPGPETVAAGNLFPQDSASQAEASQTQATSIPRPSFDCAKATYRDEKLICKMGKLASLDVLTTQAYKQAHTSSHLAALVAARKFIIARRACRESVYCIAGQQLAALEIYRALGATVSDPQ